MKKNQFLMVAALSGAMAFASCNSDERIGDVDNSREVKFTSGITAQPKVAIEGVNSVWEIDDPVGIFMVDNGMATIAESADNIQYTAELAGANTSFTPSGTPIYFPVDGTRKVDFIAYHPYNVAVTNWVYPIDVSNQTSQSAIDLMWATADNLGVGYCKEDGIQSTQVNFEFEHQLTKLVFTAIPGAGVPTPLPNDMTVSINGMNTKANFNLIGTAGISGNSNPASITPFKKTGEFTYEAILLPQSSLNNSHTVTFTIGSDTYTWVMSKNFASLAQGKIYTYNITLKRYSLDATGTIKPWLAGGNGDGIAN